GKTSNKFGSTVRQKSRGPMSKTMLNPVPVTKDCDFCREQEHQSNNRYTSSYEGILRDRTILLTQHFRIFPSLGQIAEGHVLITPLQHYTATAEMPLTLIADMEDVCSRVRSALQLTYGRCMFFEHGTRTKDCGGCGIYHAHMHALPVNAASVHETL